MPQRRFQPNLSASRDHRVAGGNPVAGAPVRARAGQTHHDHQPSSDVCTSSEELPSLSVQPVNLSMDDSQILPAADESLSAIDRSPIHEATKQSAEEIDNSSPTVREEQSNVSPAVKKSPWIRKRVAPKLTPVGERRAKRVGTEEVKERISLTSSAEVGQGLANDGDALPNGLPSSELSSSASLATTTVSTDPLNDSASEPDVMETVHKASYGQSRIASNHERETSTPVLPEHCPVPNDQGQATTPVATKGNEETKRGRGRARAGRKGTARQGTDPSRESPAPGQGTAGRKRDRKPGEPQGKEAGSAMSTVSPGNEEESADLAEKDGGDGLEDESSPAKRRRGAAGKKRKASEVASARMQQFREAPDRSSMTMQQLIYYNPSSNPMKRSKRQRKVAVTESENSKSSSPRAADLRQDNDTASLNGRSPGDDGDGGSGRLVPKLKIAADGTIAVDENSMVVESSSASLLEETRNSQAIFEEDDYTTSTSFRAKHRSKKWTETETVSFYEALVKVGTDFTMMTLLLPKRSRKELKNKFKKEEKSNPHRVTRAMEKLCSKSS